MHERLILFLAFGLAMDAFAVSVSDGMYFRSPPLRQALQTGLAFGLFQAGMPLIGYWAGSSFSALIDSYAHLAALILLSVIGGKMIAEARREPDTARHDRPSRPLSMKALCAQAVATSIDALAAGVGLGVMQVNPGIAAGCIGAVTFLCSFAGICVGRRFGDFLGRKAGAVGGIVLILLGVRIFLEHIL